MTEDDISRGLSTTEHPHRRAVRPGRRPVLHRVDDRDAADRRRTAPTSCGSSTTTTSGSTTGTKRTASPKNPFAGPAADPVFELHNLTADPEERHNRVDDADDALRQMQTILDAQRDAKRNLPIHRNPIG